MSVNAYRAHPVCANALGEERVVPAELVEVPPIAVRFAAVLADEHRADALAGVGGERVGALEDRCAACKGIEVWRDGARVTAETEVGPKGVDRDEHEVRVLRQATPFGARCEGRGLRVCAFCEGEITAGAVLVDPVVGDVLGARSDVRVVVVAVSAAEPRARTVVVAVPQLANEREWDARSRGTPFEDARGLYGSFEAPAFLKREHEGGHRDDQRRDGRYSRHKRGAEVNERHEPEPRERRAKVELGTLQNAVNS